MNKHLKLNDGKLFELEILNVVYVFIILFIVVAHKEEGYYNLMAPRTACN